LELNVRLESPNESNFIAPNEKDIEIICRIFGVQDKFKYAQQVSTRLSTYTLSHSKNSLDRVESMHPWEVLYAYMWWILNTDDLLPYLDADQEMLEQPHVFQTVIASRNLSTEQQINGTKQYLDDIKKLDLNSVLKSDPNYWMFYWIIRAVCVSNFSDEAIDSISDDDYVQLVSILLMSPGYLHGATKQEQEKFMRRLVQKISKSKYSWYLRNSQSNFWKYLEKYFWEKEDSSIISKVSDDTWKVLHRILWLELIPSESEIRELSSYFWQEYRIQEIIELSYTLHKTLKETPIRTRQDLAWKDSTQIVMAHLSWALNTTAINEWKDYEQYRRELWNWACTAYWILVSRFFPEKQKERIISEAVKQPKNKDQDLTVQWEIDNMATVIAFLSYEQRLTEKYLSHNDFRETWVILLAYPWYLQSASNEEQARFFEMLFLSERDNPEFQNKDSSIWSYLIKYFWNIVDVRATYDHLFSRKITPETYLLRDITPEEIREKAQLTQLLSIFELSERKDYIFQLRQVLKQTEELAWVSVYDEFEWRDIQDIWLMYLWWFLDTRLFDNEKIPNLTKNIRYDTSWADMYYNMLFSSHQNDRKWQRLYLESFAAKEKDNIALTWLFMEEISMLTLGILLLKLPKELIEKSGISEEFQFQALLHLLVLPGYIQNTRLEEQKVFFSIFFKKLERRRISKNDRAIIDEYIEDVFWNIDTKSRNDLLWTSISGTKLTSIEAKEVREVLKSVRQWKRASDLITLRWRLNWCRGEAAKDELNLSEYIDFDIAAMYIAWGLAPSEYDDSLTSSDILGWSIPELLLNHKRHSLERQKWILLTEARKIPSMTEAELMMFSILLLKLDTTIVEIFLEDIDVVRLFSLILLDRRYLQATSQEERNTFFRYLFQYWESESLIQRHSVVSRYILKHFPDNDVVEEYLGWPESSSTEVVLSSQEKEKALTLPAITTDNTRIQREWETYTLTTDVELPEWVYFVIGIWSRKKGWDIKDISFQVFNSTEDITLDLVRGQWVIAGIHKSKSINTSILKANPERFETIAIPFPRQEPQKNSPPPKTPTKPTAKKATLTPKPEKEDWPDQSILELWVLSSIQDWIECEVIWHDGISEIDITPSNDFCEASFHCWIETNSYKIIYDLTQTPAKLISFLGIEWFKVLDSELQDKLNKVTQRQRSRYLEILEEGKQRDIHHSIDSIASFPYQYREAIAFFRACNTTDLVVPKIWNFRWKDIPGPIWCLPIPWPIQASIDKELGSRWFSVVFNQWDIILRHSDSNDKVIFDWISPRNIQEIVAKEWSSPNEKNRAIARYLLEYVLAIIVYSYYKNNRSKSKEQSEINKRKVKREGILAETKIRLDNEEADLIIWWDPEWRKDIWWFKASTSSKNILWKRGLIQIGNSNLTDSKREEIYNEIEAQMFQGKSKYLMNYFFDRIRATHWLKSEFAPIWKERWADIILWMNTPDIKLKEQICREALNRLRERKVSMVLMEPVSFGYNELLWN